MKYSKYNIFSKIRGSENFYIVNLLTGNADILYPDDAEKVKKLKEKGSMADLEFINELFAKGYLIDEKEEEKLFRNKYLNFLDSMEKDEIQVFFVTNYSCNFACSYCYQNEYSNIKETLSEELINAFIDYIHKEFAGRKKYITLFGGEPLLNSPSQKEIIKYFLNVASNRGLEVCIVTNGYSLDEYLHILTPHKIREIQVTLDGTEKIHNSRRFLKNGTATFDKIVNGIDSCLKHNININLRMVIDKDNIENLPDFARFAIDKGWTESSYFKTQLGRNYELHHCQVDPDRLFNRIEMFEKIFELAKIHPHILEFYKPAFSISKFLADHGSIPDPLFDSCPACKTEWAFDYTGHIYPCTATVGKSDESLGTYYPSLTRFKPKIREWETRDITTISDCKDCSLQLACGGGCGSIAKNKTGKVASKDCRPIQKLLELGFASYFQSS